MALRARCEAEGSIAGATRGGLVFLPTEEIAQPLVSQEGDHLVPEEELGRGDWS
jgi:hypothetical protein